MNKLNLVKEKIVAAVPEIMELTYGCEFLLVEHGGEQKVCGTYVDEVEGVDTLIAVDYMHWNGSFRKLPVEEIHEVLGRPIQLADVLRAIIKDHPDNKTIWTIEADGQFIETLFNGSFTEKFAREKWDLSKPLDGQSEETISFLFDLLCYEK